MQNLFRKKQRGIGVVGVLLIVILVVFIGVIVVRVIPGVMEFQTIARVARYAATNGGNESQIRNNYDSQLRIEGVYDPMVKPEDLQIRYEGNKAIVSFSYNDEIQLLGPVYLVIKYHKEETGTNY